MQHPDNFWRRPDRRAGGVHDDFAFLDLGPVDILGALELRLEETVTEVSRVIAFAIIHIPFPFAFETDGVIRQVDDLEADQAGKLIHLKGEVALEENNIGRFDLQRMAAGPQVALQVMAGRGREQIVTRDGDFLAFQDIGQASLEQPKMGRFPTHRLVLPELPVEQEVVHFDGGGLLAHFLEGVDHAFDDLGLTGRGRTGQGDQNRGPADGEEFLDHFDEGLVDLLVGFEEIQITDILHMVELLLARLEGAERFPAQMGQCRFREVDRAGQEVKSAQVEEEEAVHPIRAVLSCHQTDEQHEGQAVDALIQNDVVLIARLGLDGIIEGSLADHTFYPCLCVQHDRVPACFGIDGFDGISELIKRQFLEGRAERFHPLEQGLGEFQRGIESA